MTEVFPTMTNCKAPASIFMSAKLGPSCSLPWLAIAAWKIGGETIAMIRAAAARGSARTVRIGLATTNKTVRVGDLDCWRGGCRADQSEEEGEDESLTIHIKKVCENLGGFVFEMFPSWKRDASCPWVGGSVFILFNCLPLPVNRNRKYNSGRDLRNRGWGYPSGYDTKVTFPGTLCRPHYLIRYCLPSNNR